MAGSLRSPGDSDGDDSFAPPMAEINVTPMVDVMLVLLVIFMVAAPLMTVGVPVRLPKTASAQTAQPQDPIVVSIDRDGRVFLREEELSGDILAGRLRELAAQNPDQIVLVRGDRMIGYGQVMAVMGQIGAAGFQRVSLIGEAQGGGQSPAVPVQAAPN